MLGIFSLISIAYLGIAGYTLVQVVARWPALWSPTPGIEAQHLTRRAAFFLLIPPTVALHELGHAAAIWAIGQQVEDWFFLGFVGAVVHRPAGPIGNFVTALAGNVVTLAIGIGAIAFGLFRVGHPTRNLAALELGRQSCFLVLVFYPLLCLGFDGDFTTIYDFASTPVASAFTAIVHLLILGIGYGRIWRQRWLPRARLVAGPAALQLSSAEARLRSDPRDGAAHRVLGELLLGAGDAPRAIEHLKVALESHPDPRVELALGLALLDSGQPAAAIAPLQAARDRLFRPEDRRAADEALARAGAAR